MNDCKELQSPSLQKDAAKDSDELSGEQPKCQMTVNADKAVCVLTCFAPSQNVVDFGNPRGPEDPFLPAAGISPSKTDVETPNGSLDERDPQETGSSGSSGGYFGLPVNDGTLGSDRLTNEEFVKCLWTNCTRIFSQLEDLINHVNDDHVKTEKETDYTCRWKGCARKGKAFNARYKMLIHVRTHTNEKPHRCIECGKSFSRLENLKIHNRSHTGEKPYICPMAGCNKAYSNSSDRFKHTRTHFVDKPYACKKEGCDKRYTDPSSLRKHMKTYGHYGEGREISVQGSSSKQGGKINHVSENALPKLNISDAVDGHHLTTIPLTKCSTLSGEELVTSSSFLTVSVASILANSLAVPSSALSTKGNTFNDKCNIGDMERTYFVVPSNGSDSKLETDVQSSDKRRDDKYQLGPLDLTINHQENIGEDELSKALLFK